MAKDIRLTFDTDGTVTSGDIRAALDDLTDDDITVQSPVEPGIPGVATAVDGDEMTVIAGDGSDEFSKTTQRAIKSAVTGIEGVEEHVSTEGGYETDDGDGGEG